MPAVGDTAGDCGAVDAAEGDTVGAAVVGTGRTDGVRDGAGVLEPVQELTSSATDSSAVAAAAG
jgi:hypothetical protein